MSFQGLIQQYHPKAREDNQYIVTTGQGVKVGLRRKTSASEVVEETHEEAPDNLIEYLEWEYGRWVKPLVGSFNQLKQQCGKWAKRLSTDALFQMAQLTNGHMPNWKLTPEQQAIYQDPDRLREYLMSILIPEDVRLSGEEARLVLKEMSTPQRKELSISQAIVRRKDSVEDKAIMSTIKKETALRRRR